MYNILEQGKRLTLIIKNDAKKYKPLIMCGTNLYDPFNKLRPVNGAEGARALRQEYHEEARELYTNGKESWIPPDPAEEKQPKLEGKQLELYEQPVSRLEHLLAETVAKIAVNDVVEIAKPMLDSFITETYGVLPKRLEVKSPAGKHIVTGVTHEKFETVLKIVNQDIPVFLTGPAGCGKNVICKQVSEALGLEFYFSNAVTQEYKLTGFIDANGRYQETQFFKAFINGGLFMLDEIDASTPEVLVILNAAIANRYFDFPTGKVTAHENFRVVAGGNTTGSGADIEYSGRYQLDAASLDRFAIVEIDYSPTIEETVANGNMELVKFIHDFRAAVEMAKIKFIVSYRAIERLHKLEQVFDKADAIKIALLKGLDKDDAKMLCSNLNGDTQYENALRQAVA